LFLGVSRQKEDVMVAVVRHLFADLVIATGLVARERIGHPQPASRLMGERFAVLFARLAAKQGRAAAGTPVDLS